MLYKPPPFPLKEPVKEPVEYDEVKVLKLLVWLLKLDVRV
jgi:hypothetical protein